MAVSPLSVPDDLAVVVWLDHWHALIAQHLDGHDGIREIDREADPEPAYLRRVAAAACDCQRVMILGPDDDRLAFDHEYEAMYERRDRFVEVEACPRQAPSALLDRLRLLEGIGETL